MRRKRAWGGCWRMIRLLRTLEKPKERWQRSDRPLRARWRESEYRGERAFDFFKYRDMGRKQAQGTVWFRTASAMEALAWLQETGMCALVRTSSRIHVTVCGTVQVLGGGGCHRGPVTFSVEILADQLAGHRAGAGDGFAGGASRGRGIARGVGRSSPLGRLLRTQHHRHGRAGLHGKIGTDAAGGWRGLSPAGRAAVWTDEWMVEE